MNSVEQARSRRRSAPLAAAGITASPTVVAPSGPTRVHAPAPPLQKPLGKSVLPQISPGAVYASSPKAARIANSLSVDKRRMNDESNDNEDDVEAMLRRMDCDLPGDAIDQLSEEDQRKAAEVFGVRITPEYLRTATGFEELHLVTSAELRIDCRITAGAELIGEAMPRLVQLRLSHSFIPEFRELGAKWQELQVLHLNNARVKTLRGVGACKKLRELYVAFNLLSSVGDIVWLQNLEVLDLEGNNLQDSSEVEALASLERLSTLCLSGNPVAYAWGRSSSSVAPSTTKATLREAVREWMPWLKTLDDAPLSTPPRTPLASASSSQPTDHVAGERYAQHCDPTSWDDSLAAELQLLQSSIRSNVQMDRGLEGAIEAQHRSLYSRQSTSCAGARRRTPASQSASRITVPPSGESGRSHVHSAPELRLPQKDAPAMARTSSGAAAGSGSSSSAAFGSQTAFATSFPAFLTSTVAAPPAFEAASSLTSGGSMFAGSAVKSLRRRLPSISGAQLPTSSSLTGVGKVSDEVLSAMNSNDPSTSTRYRTPREHELAKRLVQLRECERQGQRPSTADELALERLLEELDLEFEFECGADVVDAAGRATGGSSQNRGRDSVADKAAQLAQALHDEQPHFLSKYAHLLNGHEVAAGDGASDRATAACGVDERCDAERTSLSNAELLLEVARYKARTLRDTADGLVENPQRFESLRFDDLGGNVDDVL